MIQEMKSILPGVKLIFHPKALLVQGADRYVRLKLPRLVKSR